MLEPIPLEMGFIVGGWVGWGVLTKQPVSSDSLQGFIFYFFYSRFIVKKVEMKLTLITSSKQVLNVASILKALC